MPRHVYIMIKSLRKDDRVLEVFQCKPPFCVRIEENKSPGFRFQTAKADTRDNIFGIITGGDTLVEIENEIIDWIWFLWDCYALDDETPMTAGAKLLKKLLLAHFQELKEV